MNNFREFIYKLSIIGGETAIACGNPISYSGNQGIFLVNVTLGTDLGISGIVFDAQGIPDRFQIEFDGVLVADSKYVGDSFTGNPPDTGGLVGSTFLNVPEYYWDGVQFVANGNTQDLTVTQDDVAEFGLTDGNGTITFDKELTTPAVMTIKVFAPLGGTAWVISDTLCPDNTVTTFEVSTTSTDVAWTANSITNGGAPLRWNATNGIVYGKDGNNPVFNLSSNLGTVDFSVYNTVNVTNLNLESLEVTSVDLAGNVNLGSLNLGINSLTSLDISENTGLTSLSCYTNNLTSLDVSTNTALLALSCYENSILSLDVSNNTSLQYLYCSDNAISTLSVAVNTALLELNCDTNTISSLNVNTNTSLTSLICSNNTITTLDVSLNTSLVLLACNNNTIATLDVSTNTGLTYLDCSDNSLTNLDITSNTLLTVVRCGGNALIAGDIDSILIQLDTNGLLNGSIIIPLGRTAASDAAKTSLEGKGWTVIEV